MEDEVKSKLYWCIFWVVVLTGIFFMVGVGLNVEGDGKKFDPIKFYGLLKDALAFGLALIAPLVVYIFFNDWRGQYRAVKAETYAEEIVDNFKKLCSSIEEKLRYLANNDDKTNDQELLVSYLEELQGDHNAIISGIDNLERLKKINSLEFINLSKELLKVCTECIDAFSFIKLNNAGMVKLVDKDMMDNYKKGLNVIHLNKMNDVFFVFNSKPGVNKLQKDLKILLKDFQV